MAEILHEFHRRRADISYHPIVGSGPNACVLHYRDEQPPDAGRRAAADRRRLRVRLLRLRRDAHAARRRPLQPRASARSTRSCSRRSGRRSRRSRAGGALERAARGGGARHHAGARAHRPAEGPGRRSSSRTAPTASSSCTAPATGSAWTCTTSASTRSASSGGCWSPAWSRPSSPASTSRPAPQGVRREWWGIGVRIEDDVVVTDGKPEVLTAGDADRSRRDRAPDGGGVSAPKATALRRRHRGRRHGRPLARGRARATCRSTSS